jgi:TrmH family RNA methyltransferase
MSENDSRQPQAFGDLLPLPEGVRVVVVLVEPKDPRNIGAVARAMSNLGISDLRLVAPARYDRTIARGVACWGASIVDAAPSFESLSGAITDAHEVVGFASDSASHRVPQLLLDEWVEMLAHAPDKTVALVFGSEESGLKRDHYPLCQFLVRIPSSAANASYNLAQSVLLALYALRRRLSSEIGSERGEWPTNSHLEHFVAMVLDTARDVGFLNENSPAHMRDLLANMVRRGHYSTKELRIFTGLFGQINKGLRRGSGGAAKPR